MTASIHPAGAGACRSPIHLATTPAALGPSLQPVGRAGRTGGLSSVPDFRFPVSFRFLEASDGGNS